LFRSQILFYNHVLLRSLRRTATKLGSCLIFRTHFVLTNSLK
jgi:hypothetical protein